MIREEAPGPLDVEPASIVEAFLVQEALRYRRALIEIEGELGGDPVEIARRALDEGDEVCS